ncbi:hypothetical protein IWW37_001426 [Coemansia sp. RSA 2050]|nr:hypothetical protein IWW37_001426 [Coemansia sp. RSA 2050]
MSTCHQLLTTHIATISNTDTLQLCQVADRLRRHTKAGQLGSMGVSFQVLAIYLQFYAHLGRPDITQKAFSQVRLQWRQPELSVYDTQILALIKRAADQATGSHLLGKTAAPGESVSDLASRISRCLKARPITVVIRDIMRHERQSRFLAKLVEYSVISAIAMLGVRGAQIENTVLTPAMSVVPRTLTLCATFVAVILGFRFILRHTMMGRLATPAPIPKPDNLWGPVVDLPKDCEAEVHRILSRAFPASPSNEALLEINSILYSGHSGRPRIPWKLRLALAWSRFARSCAIIEPMLPSTHEMHQRLASLWLRNLVHMFPHPSTSAKQMAVASEAVAEFATFVRANFHNTTPLTLSRSDISALSRFAVQETGTEAFADYLSLVTAGFLGLERGAEPKKEGHHQPTTQTRMELKREITSKNRAGAIVLTYITCIHHLSRRPIHREKLSLLLDSLQTHREMPVSASLYYAAFVSADQILNDPAQAHRLADSLESRFTAQDPFVQHIVRTPPPQPVGWKLSATHVVPHPIVHCIAPYLAVLAREPTGDRLAELVDRWMQLGILSRLAAIQCLSTVVHDQTSAPSAESWALQACTYASDPQTDDTMSIALSLDPLLQKALSICESAEHARAVRVLAAYRTAADRQPKLKTLSSADLNSQVVNTLATLSLNAINSESKELIQRAQDTLDHMHCLSQIPSPSAIDRLRQAAAHSGVDITNALRHWTTRGTKRLPENKDISAFAKTLF